MRYKFKVIIFVLGISIACNSICTAEDYFDARVMDISDRDYEGVVIKLIDGAKESVVIGMYQISTGFKKNNPVSLLLRDLAEAAARGVRVRLYLNTKFPDRDYEELAGQKEFDALEKAGCEVYFIPPSRKFHDKVIVVDNRYVVEGSMNWSIIALRNNFESATLIDSPELAGEKTARIETIYRMQKAKERAEAEKRKRRPLYLNTIIKTIEIKKALLEDGKFFPAMLKASDRRVMELYLILAAYSQKRWKDEFYLDLEDAALGVGLPVSWDDESLRRQAIKALRTLQDRYGLLKVEFYYGSDARVKMAEVPGETFKIETAALEPPDKEFSQKVKFLLMVRALVRQEGGDPDALSQKEIAQRFHIAERTLEKALAELKYSKNK